jgi:hypothetical protein
MGHYEHRALVLAQCVQGIEQGGVAGLVQVGVGLVQHDQGRITVQGAGQGDALALTARKHYPPSPMAVS